MQSDFVPVHEVRTATIRLHAPPAQAFPLFEPEGERAWAPGWDPTWLHPLDGRACEGGVFVTGARGQETIWTITAHEPSARVRYSRVTPGVHAVTVDVRLRPADADETLADITYTITALTPAGNGAVAEIAARYDGWMVEWEQAINAALEAAAVGAAVAGA
jgi:hypothetical protein